MPKPSPAHVVYLVFVLPAMPELRPDLPRHMYFICFSCPQKHQSYAQTFASTRILRGFRAPSDARATPRPSPAHVFYMVFVPQRRQSYTQTFPGTRILRGFRAPNDTTATPKPSPAHVIYMVLVPPVPPMGRQIFYFHCKLYVFRLHF